MTMENYKNTQLICSECLLRFVVPHVSYCSKCLCTGRFVPLNLTCLLCLQRIPFEHLFSIAIKYERINSCFLEEIQ